MSNLAKSILDRWATRVLTTEDVGRDCAGRYFVKGKWKLHAELFEYKEYSTDICLWVRPKDCVCIEFDGITTHEPHCYCKECLEQNKKWIEDTEEACQKLGFDYCVCEHRGGQSPYIWLFNFDKLETHEQRKAIGELLVPKDSHIDWNNFGDNTLVPVLFHKHWKHKNYHYFVRGKYPLQHDNKLPDNLLVKETKPNVNTPLSCDVLSDDFVKKILETDTKVQTLMSGNISGYNTPSEARMGLICCLVAYGLSDIQIQNVMGMSLGLNYKEKLLSHEVSKARTYCTKKRSIYET